MVNTVAMRTSDECIQCIDFGGGNSVQIQTINGHKNANMLNIVCIFRRENLTVKGARGLG